eukprot:GHVT01055347.1.p1 GENE.GHVT01055347.1~~GHVT01055347.1.p1  ORF type:complete len:137 (-),score=6.32 GHVT01055347.1:241-651(-)
MLGCISFKGSHVGIPDAHTERDALSNVPVSVASTLKQLCRDPSKLVNYIKCCLPLQTPQTKNEAATLVVSSLSRVRKRTSHLPVVHRLFATALRRHVAWHSVRSRRVRRGAWRRRPTLTLPLVTPLETAARTHLVM